MGNRNATPNHAVYEEQSPYGGPVGFKYGTPTVGEQPVIALHPNSDGTYTGVAADGSTVELGGES